MPDHLGLREIFAPPFQSVVHAAIPKWRGIGIGCFLQSQPSRAMYSGVAFGLTSVLPVASDLASPPYPIAIDSVFQTISPPYWLSSISPKYSPSTQTQFIENRTVGRWVDTNHSQGGIHVESQEIGRQGEDD